MLAFWYDFDDLLYFGRNLNSFVRKRIETIQNEYVSGIKHIKNQFCGKKIEKFLLEPNLSFEIQSKINHLKFKTIYCIRRAAKGHKQKSRI